MRIWPGLKRQNKRSDIGVGSHTASSQTSRALSGCALDSADGVLRTLDRYRRGEDAIGDESTRTLCAEGVFGVTSTEASKRR